MTFKRRDLESGDLHCYRLHMTIQAQGFACRAV